MQCPKCNSPNGPDAVFCSECGGPVTEGPKGSPSKARRSYLYSLLLIPVIVAGVAIGYYKFLLPEGVAAIVNGEEIKISELEAAVEPLKAGYDRNSVPADAEQQMRRLRYRALDGLITERLVLQEARKAGVTVSEADVAAAIEQGRQSPGMNTDGFNKAINSRYGSFSAYREALGRQLLMKKFIAEKIVPKGADAHVAGEVLDSWMQRLYSRSLVRITLSEQVSGAECGCCGSGSNAHKDTGCSMESMGASAPGSSAGSKVTP